MGGVQTREKINSQVSRSSDFFPLIPTTCPFKTGKTKLSVSIMILTILL
jgi:hypothetical protein